MTRGRPRNDQDRTPVEVQASPKLVAYLDEIRKMEEFGVTRPEIVKRFVWDGIGKLILEKRLKKK